MKEELALFIQSLFSTQGQIPLHAPFISELEDLNVQQELQSGLFSTASTSVAKFEEQLSSHIKSKYVVATNSGTAALHTALLLSGVTIDDMVLTSPLSFVATANVIRYCGATPHFIDVSEKNLAISPIKLKSFLQNECDLKSGLCVHKATGKKIRVCLLVHAFGNAAELSEITEILNEFSIELVEDAAQAFLSSYKEKFCGTFGRFGCYSFNGNKFLTTGSGGALVCQNEADYIAALQLVSQGKEVRGYGYYHSMVGYNYKMNGLSAVIGLAQLLNVDEIKRRKKAIAEAYRDFFQEWGIELIREQSGTESNFWLTNILLHSKEEKNTVIDYLNASKIEARPIWWPIDQLPMYQNKTLGKCNVANTIFERLISLPSGSLYKV